MAARKVPTHHAHGCFECRRRYTDTCAQPLLNARCYACRTGRPVPCIEAGWLPRACCTQRAKLVTDTDTLNRYALGGSTAWWQCRTCYRTHPFNPAIEV
jgi:hypothetical protein